MDIDAKSDGVFLATTALEQFWESTKPLVFLGSWCLLYERSSHWKTLGGQLLSSPYASADEAEQAYCHVRKLHEKMLPLLATALNSIHGTNHSERYWRILLGPWLQQYLSVAYDRYRCIKHALCEYPGLSTIGLAEQSFVVPADTLDFACLLLEDSYNLQFYTKILSALGVAFPRRETEVARNPLYRKLLVKSWKRRLISRVVTRLADVSAIFFNTLILRNPYFSKQFQLQLIRKKLGRILPDLTQMNPCPRFECDSVKRAQLRAIEIGSDEFESCLSAMLFSDIPQCFVEGYNRTANEARQAYPKRAAAIFSANGWYYDEVFKQWAACRADEGTLLLGTPHGGNYGALKSMPSEDHETAIVDYYYSWGWERDDCAAKVLPMPASKLAGREKIGADNSKSGILWAATSVPRYLSQFPFLPVHFQDYLAWQSRFARSLSTDLIGEIRFRPHYENYSWGTVERMKDCIPDIRIDSWDVPFQVSLENCRLYVCDHLSTTFAEALAANKPTLLFCNPETNPLRAEAQPYFDLLKAGGILFDTPEAAALAAEAVYDDVETWWNVPERQELIRSFCERFARTSPDAAAIWTDEFDRVLNSPPVARNR